MNIISLLVAKYYNMIIDHDINRVRISKSTESVKSTEAITLSTMSKQNCTNVDVDNDDLESSLRINYPYQMDN